MGNTEIWESVIGNGHGHPVRNGNHSDSAPIWDHRESDAGFRVER